MPGSETGFEIATVENDEELRKRVQYASFSTNLQVLVVTSASYGDGKARVAEKLAMKLAKKNKTILVNCDLRVTTNYRLRHNKEIGLVDFLEDGVSFNKITETVNKNLDLIVAGTRIVDKPEKLLETSEMKELIEKLRGIYDSVILEIEPMLQGNSLEVLGKNIDKVALVAKKGFEDNSFKKAKKKVLEVKKQKNELKIQEEEFQGKNKFFENGKKIRSILLFLVDIISINLALFASFYIKYDEVFIKDYGGNFSTTIIVLLFSYLTPLIAFKMYKSLWRNAGFDEIIRATFAVIIGMIISFILLGLASPELHFTIIFLTGILTYLAVIGSRLSYRIYRRLEIYGNMFMEKDYKKVLIIGAGAYAQIIIDEMHKDRNNNYKPVALIDDNPEKRNSYLRGIKVYGNRKLIKNLVEEMGIELIVIAISNIDGKNKKELIEICKGTNTKTKIVPPISEMIGNKVSLKTMRDIDLKDLLGRDEIKLDKNGIVHYIKEKTVLVTGGGGSIGSELCRQIANFNPKLLIILDNYENNAYDIENELNRKIPSLDKRTIIATVREKERIREIFESYKPEVVFHAAAHKHVPLMETAPIEAIKNNAKGTLNVAELALEYEVEKFVLISTDKAVNPTNVMGATKRICEMVVQGMAKESKKLGKKTEFAAVRFGNVLGSNGSVIPLFKKQIAEGGPLTLTDKNITRYFMLIPEAVQLVLQAGAFARGGEIFVLDMGQPVKIHDLAIDLIKLTGLEPYKDIDVKITGLRPGEKLYEELLMDEEGLENTTHNKIFVGKPGNFSVKEIKLKINNLIKVGEEGDKEKLKDEIEKVVPTYIREADKLVAASREP